MFPNDDLDERGEVPAPFCIEKHNFNPHNLLGDFDGVAAMLSEVAHMSMILKTEVLPKVAML